MDWVKRFLEDRATPEYSPGGSHFFASCKWDDLSLSALMRDSLDRNLQVSQNQAKPPGVQGCQKDFKAASRPLQGARDRPSSRRVNQLVSKAFLNLNSDHLRLPGNQEQETRKGLLFRAFFGPKNIKSE